jgi:hypothetical protein
VTLIASFFHWLVEWLPVILIGTFLLGFYSAAIHSLYTSLTSKDKHHGNK